MRMMTNTTLRMTFENGPILFLSSDEEGSWSWTATFYEDSIPNDWNPNHEEGRKRWSEVVPEGVGIDYWHRSQSPWRVDLRGRTDQGKTAMEAFADVSSILAPITRALES